jgi:hypothetical protein
MPHRRPAPSHVPRGRQAAAAVALVLYWFSSSSSS